jgi:hypothetical protein
MVEGLWVRRLPLDWKAGRAVQTRPDSLLRVAVGPVQWPTRCFPLENWLSGMDSNHDKELQRLLCYHYTTGQGAFKLALRYGQRKGKMRLGTA